MLRSTKSDGIPVPKGWPRHVRSVVGLSLAKTSSALERNRLHTA